MLGKPQDARHGGVSWAGTCRLVDQDGRVPAATATLTAARVISDGADAIWFGSLPLTGGQRAKIGGAAAGWAALETAAQLADRRL